MTDDNFFTFFFPAQPSILRAGPSCAEQEEIWSYMTVPPVPFCDEEDAPVLDKPADTNESAPKAL